MRNIIQTYKSNTVIRALKCLLPLPRSICMSSSSRWSSVGLFARRFSSASAAPTTSHLPLEMFTQEENDTRDMVKKWAKEELAPHVSSMDANGKLAPSVLSSLFSSGLMGLEIPSEYNGSALNFTSSCIVIEELARVDPAVSVIVDIQNTLINTAIIKYGSKDIKERYLPRLATDTLGSFCLSEAQSGSDAFALTTRATRTDRDSWCINGSKMWISNAREAGLFVVFANVAPEKGYKGITAFIVEKGARGLTVGKAENKLGIRASSTCELHFDNVMVASNNILGNIGEGYKIAIGSLNEGRIGIASQMLGLAEGAFDAAFAYIHQRKQFGELLINFQGMQFNVAQCATEIQCAKLLVYNACRLKEAGMDFIVAAAQAKLKASQVAELVASQAVEWHGGVGFTKDYPVEKFYRDAKIGSIYEGTTNLQLQTIAKLLSKDYLSKQK